MNHTPTKPVTSKNLYGKSKPDYAPTAAASMPMTHTPTRGDTIVINGTPQTLECVVHRFITHDELVTALQVFVETGAGRDASDPLHYAYLIASAALAKVQAPEQARAA